MFPTSKFLKVSAMFYIRGQSLFKFASKVYEGLLLGYDSNYRVKHIFNVTTGCVEITCDAVFDETNGS
jgi:hypothetical protein